jgi:hypothetical protein
VKKVLPRRAQMASRQRRVSAPVGLFRQRQPCALPRVFIARLDILHRPGDVENVAAALLGLSDQTQRMAAKRMIGKEKIEHAASDDLQSE